MIDKGLPSVTLGLWTGKRLATLARRPEWATMQHSPSTFRFPEGESFSEMQARVWEAVSTIASRHRTVRSSW